MNYTGLRKGDSDYEGYISKGDLNMNGLIDAYDISNVAIVLEDGINGNSIQSVEGTVSVKVGKTVYNAGETIEINVSGKGLRSVNALSFALPYVESDMEYIGTDAYGMKDMKNLTYDRLHTNGEKSLYPTFVNLGEKECLEGDTELMTIRFRAKRKFTLDIRVSDGILVDKHLNTSDF